MVKTIKDGAIKAFNDSNPSQDGTMFGYGGNWWKRRNLANQWKHTNKCWWWPESWNCWYDKCATFYSTFIHPNWPRNSSINGSTRKLFSSSYQLVSGVPSRHQNLDSRANEKENLHCVLLTNLPLVHKKQLLAFQTLQPWKLEMEWFDSDLCRNHHVHLKTLGVLRTHVFSFWPWGSRACSFCFWKSAALYSKRHLLGYVFGMMVPQ